MDINEKYAALTETLRDCVIYTLDAAGTIMSWSIGAETMKGFRAEEVIGQNLSILYAPEDVTQGKHLRALHLAAAQGRFDEESWRLRKDGSRIWSQSIIVPFRSPDGRLEGYFKISRDATERKRAEESRE